MGTRPFNSEAVLALYGVKCNVLILLGTKEASKGTVGQNRAQRSDSLSGER